MSDIFSFDGPVEVIAHRGFSARGPENTLAALELAITAGAPAVEFDIHCAGDGTAFLFHDATLNRTTNGTGPIRGWSSAALAELDAGSWFSEDFDGEPIPSLEQAMAALRGRVSTVYPEIKGYREPNDVARLATTVVDADMMADTVFISLDWASLQLVREHLPEARIGYVVETEKRVAEAFDLASGDERALLDFNKRVLLDDPSIAERAHAAAIELAAWTVNEVEDAVRLLEIGVPRITTNEVSTMIAWVDTL